MTTAPQQGLFASWRRAWSRWREARYRRRVHRRLDALLKDVTEEATASSPTLDLHTGRFIIFSDQHRGLRNSADDFQVCEKAYHAALAYYYKRGHTLVVLGDAEELWEEKATDVLNAYAYSLGLEAGFHRAGRYLRFWGNHDDQWALPRSVDNILAPVFGGPALRVYEALRIEVTSGAQTLGALFLIHGHQGTGPSDRWSWLSKRFVRYVWRPLQRLTKWTLNTPAKDWVLRQKHGMALYSWAEAQNDGAAQKLILISGHTHHPVFRSYQADAIRQELEALEVKLAQNPDDVLLQQAVALHAAKYEWFRTLEGAGLEMPSPCYFNSGCCCFSDGDVTGLEIADGKIRLVRWPNDAEEPAPKELAAADLQNVLAAC